MRTIPIDSTDAREQADLEAAATAAVAEEQALHDAECRGGWRGEDHDGRPRPCVTCRPHLAHVSCRTCSAPWQSCQTLRAVRRGPCCERCHHTPNGAT